MAGAPTFGEYLRQFHNKPDGLKALQMFEKARRDGDDRAALRTLWRILVACYLASTFNADNDPGKVYRAALTAAGSRTQDLATAASEIALGFGAKHPGLGWALWRASGQAKVGSTAPEQRDEDAMWAEFFGALARALRGDLPEIHGGPWHHLHTFGPLLFPSRIVDGRPKSVSTALAFELVFHLRRWSGGAALHILASGSPVPDTGEPLLPLAAAFIRAALPAGEQLSADQLKGRLRGLKGVRLMPWPHKV